ncbi:MAG: DUF1579 domain-containing protein [Gemmataceae bacterium]|nr:DUF1579 domain-containing protein [Gemmataceae bacterium]
MRRASTLVMASCLVLAAARLPAQLAAQQPPAKPGPEHEKFKMLEGVWDATVHSMEGDSKGTMTRKVDLGGLWLREHFKGAFGDTTFEGRGAMSYDPAKKKYVSVWIDSMSTSPMISEGTYDKSTHTLTMVGAMPMPDGKSMKLTMITEMKDKNNVVFTMKGRGEDGKDFEMMKITYKRRAKAD